MRPAQKVNNYVSIAAAQADRGSDPAEKHKKIEEKRTCKPKDTYDADVVLTKISEGE